MQATLDNLRILITKYQKFYTGRISYNIQIVGCDSFVEALNSYNNIGASVPENNIACFVFAVPIVDYVALLDK